MCLAEGKDGSFRRVWVKSPGLNRKLPVGVLEREWMATALAHELGLPAAEVAPLLLAPDFIEALTDEPLRESLASGPDIVIASVDAGEGWSQYIAGTKFPYDQLPLIEQIVAFDCLIQNGDRCMRANPNLLRMGDSLTMIDHEEGFDLAVTREGYSRPWDINGAMTYFCQGTAQHILVQALRPKSRVNFHEVRPAWEALREANLRERAAMAPATWDHNCMDRIIAYILEAQANVEVFCEHANRLCAS